MDKSRCQHLPNEDEVITEGGVPHYEFGIVMKVDARMSQRRMKLYMKQECPSTAQSQRSNVRHQQFSPLLMQWDWWYLQS